MSLTHYYYYNPTINPWLFSQLFYPINWNNVSVMSICVDVVLCEHHIRSEILLLVEHDPAFSQMAKEGNVLFNNALNTFYLRLYDVRHMVKHHSDSEKGNPLPPHRLLFPINSKVFLYAPSHRQDSTYNGLCYTSRGALTWTRNSSMGPSSSWRIDPTTHGTMSERSYHGATSRSLSAMLQIYILKLD